MGHWTPTDVEPRVYDDVDDNRIIIYLSNSWNNKKIVNCGPVPVSRNRVYPKLA